MKGNKEIGRRLGALLLALLMCIALMPAGVFADDEGDAQVGDKIVLEQSQEPAADGAESTADEPVPCTHASLDKIAVKACNRTALARFREPEEYEQSRIIILGLSAFCG